MPLAFTTGTSSHPKNTLRKRKFEIYVLVLLHVLIPGVMLSSLETINPWLSACDLAQPEVQRSCSATQLPPRTTPHARTLSRPKQCPNNTKTDTFNPQCLDYLDETHKGIICGMNRTHDAKWLLAFLKRIRLRHCYEYKIIDTLSRPLLDRILHGKGEECSSIIASLEDVDNLAAKVSCEFTDVLSRFDCGQSYSVQFSCQDCEEAYRHWVCSSLLPFFNETRIRPCRSVCQAVEQKCPYFLPENMAPAMPTQYAGEPTFLCMDPNIPETGEQLKRSLYPEKGTCCVKVCEPKEPLEDHTFELCTDWGERCEELISYEDAMNKSVDCSASDSLGSRVSNLACPTNNIHSLARPQPLVIILSTCLIHLLTNQIHLLLFFALFNYCFFPFRFLNFLLCLYFLSLDYSKIKILFISLKRKFRFFCLIQFPKLIFNYFKFNSNKWQYYFILISVNLLFNFFNENPKPLTTPPCLINGLIIKKSENTRGTRHYNKHYFPILSNIAQKLKEIVLISRKLCGLTRRNPLKLMSANLVIETITSHEKCVRIKENSLTTNIIKIYSILIKVLLMKDSHYRLKYKTNERQKLLKKKLTETSNWSSNVMSKCIRYFKIRLMVHSVPRTNVVDKSICMFLHSSRSYKYVWYYMIESNINEKYSKKYYKRRLIPVHFKKTKRYIIVERGRGIKLKLVKSCRLLRLICSDPTCEFQTFFKKR